MPFEENDSHSDSCEGCSACNDLEEGGGPVDQAWFRKVERSLLDKGFEYVGCGMFRYTYIRNGVVIKVPYNKEGFIDNRTEARAWKTFRDKATSLGAYLAPCRLLPNGCLMMVTCNMDDVDYKNLPPWARAIDCSQVGMYKDRLVAYDYALDIPEREHWEEEWNTNSRFFHDVRLPHLKTVSEKKHESSCDCS